MSIADLKVRISANADQFDSAMKNMQKSFNKTVRKMERTGRKMTQNITMPIAAMAGAAVTAAVHFEDAFAGVRKTVDATESEFQQLRKGILDMSKEMPTSAAEIAGVAEAAGQLGIKKDSILEFTRTMVMLGDTTNMAAQEAATSLARVANILEVPQDQFDEMGSVIVDLGNNFATTEAEITEFAQRISGAANIAGLATEDVFALGAAFTSVGVEAGVGGTAVQKVLIGINTAVAEGNENLSKFAEVAGMSAEAFQQAWREDAGQAFAAFVNGLGEKGDQAAGTLEELGLADQRLMRAFLSLANAGDLLNRTIETGREAQEKNTALVEEANKRYKTMWSRIKMLGNRIYALGVSIGDALMPAVEDAIGFVEGLIKSFENLSADAKANVLKIAMLFAASGPLLLGLAKFAKVIKGLAVLVKSKFAIIVASFAAGVSVGQWFIDNWDKIAAGFEMHMLTIEQAATHTVIGIIEAFKGFFHFATQLAPPELLTDIFGIDLSEIAMDVSGVNDVLQSLNDNIESNGEEMLDATVKYYKKPWTGFFDSAKRGMKNVGSAFMDFVSGITSDTALGDFLNTLEGGFQGVKEQAEASAKALAKFQEKYGELSFKRPEVLSTDASFNAQPGGLSSFNEGMKKKAQELSDAAKIALEGSVEAFEKKQQRIRDATMVTMGIANQFTQSFGHGITNLIVHGEKFVDVLSNIGKLLLSSAIQKGLSLLLSGGLSGVSGFFGSGGGLFGTLVSSIFGRDIGGPVIANQPYLIGKGPQQELFIPDRSGSVVPNSKLRGGMGRRMSMDLNLSGDFRIKGTDLVLTLERAKHTYSR